MYCLSLHIFLLYILLIFSTIMLYKKKCNININGFLVKDITCANRLFFDLDKHKIYINKCICIDA